MTATTPFKRAWLIIPPVVSALIPLVCIPTAEWIAVAPHGTDATLWLMLVFVFPALAAVPGLFGGLAGLAFRRFRHASGIIALCSIAYLAAFTLALRVGDNIRMGAFHGLAERSKPLVEAVHRFAEKYGRPPESLDALVPEFLPSVPSTGMGAYPEYRYTPNATNYDGNPWVITVFTPSGGINFDEFMYFPLRNYPKTGYGGWLELVGDWAYVHE